MLSQFVRRLIIVAVHSGFLDRTVHTLNLAISPGMSRLGETVFNTVFLANTIKNMMTSFRLMGHIAKLNTIVGQYLMYSVGKVSQCPA